jgi:metal-responsive CopG/Arc/MetJ family transcriptional regulator
MAQIQRQATAVLSVSLPKTLRKQVVSYAKKNDITVSQFVKETLKGAIFKRQWDEARKEFAPMAKKLKIKTDEDVERIFG